MLDEAGCSVFVLSENSRIDVMALMTLRRLLDGLAKSVGESDDASRDVIVQGDRHETRQRTGPAHPDAATDTAST